MKRNNLAQVAGIVLGAVTILAVIAIAMSKLDEMLGTIC